jgi:hypothetical protein
VTERNKAIGMWGVAGLLLAALLANLELREAGAAYRPLHIYLCGPLAIYSAIRGLLFWIKG